MSLGCRVSVLVPSSGKSSLLDDTLKAVLSLWKLPSFISLNTSIVEGSAPLERPPAKAITSSTFIFSIKGNSLGEFTAPSTFTKRLY